MRLCLPQQHMRQLARGEKHAVRRGHQPFAVVRHAGVADIGGFGVEAAHGFYGIINDFGQLHGKLSDGLGQMEYHNAKCLDG